MLKKHAFFDVGIRTALISFLVSAGVMALSVLLLSATVSPIEEDNAEELLPTYLEPYRETDLALAAMEEAEGSEKLTTDLLASTIEASFGEESYVIRVAFGAVLLNRVRSPGFPSTLSAVIRTAGIFPEDSKKNSARSIHAARDAILGIDPTLGALYIMRTNDPLFDSYSESVTVIYGDYAFIR